MSKETFGYELFAPNQPLGVLILVIGLCFTAMIIFIFINVNQNNDSRVDRIKKKLAKEEQLQKIARLYPKRKE